MQTESARPIKHTGRKVAQEQDGTHDNDKHEQSNRLHEEKTFFNHSPRTDSRCCDGTDRAAVDAVSGHLARRAGHRFLV